MGTHYITMVRHGQYDRMFGDEGDLNTTGQLQAVLTADALRGHRFDAFLCSPILRARRTAERILPALEGVTIRYDSRIEECVPSIPPAMERWFGENRPHINGEHTVVCRRRVQDFYGEVFRGVSATANDRHTLVVAHGNVIRFLLAHVLSPDQHAWTNMLVYHCSLSRVMIEANGDPMVIGINDINHLAPEFRSEQ
ncbi:MAG: histidine phosphatase family protein [Chloroflexi bacterium]|nr:histidine phosphatase family protein [Chloroflexota bacterium]